MKISYQSHAAQVTESLIASIESGPGTWSAPWHHEGQSIWAPTNAATGARYRGGNTISLSLDAMLAGHKTGYWATFTQWKKLGAHVRKGAVSSVAIRWVNKKTKTQPTDTDTATEQNTTTETNSTQSTDTENTASGSGPAAMPVTFRVFNAAQVEGWDPTNNAPATNTGADEILSATGAVVLHGGNRAFYRPKTDVIQLPARQHFTSTHGFEATILHELTHWSGHPSRLDRTYGERFGDREYAAEELTAELGAAMLTAHLGVANRARQDHAAYLAEWLEILGEDPKHLFSIAARAQAAVDHILAYDTSNTEADQHHNNGDNDQGVGTAHKQAPTAPADRTAVVPMVNAGVVVRQ